MGVLSTLDFLELEGRFLRFASLRHSKKGRHQGWFCSSTLQTGKNSWVAGSFNRQVDTTAKTAGIRDASVVEHYK